MRVSCLPQFTPQPSNAFEEEEGSPADGVTRLYGEWQTVAWAPPAAKDGQVPKNERGNVNVPPYALALPAGANATFDDTTATSAKVPCPCERRPLRRTGRCQSTSEAASMCRPHTSR